MKTRHVWLPKIKVSTLNRLLKKRNHTDKEKELLLDFKYCLLFDKQHCEEWGFYYEVTGYGLTLKNNHWLTNINFITDGFESKEYIN